VRIVGAERAAREPCNELDLRGPMAWAAGCGGHGLRPTDRERCDEMARIRWLAQVERALNVVRWTPGSV